MPDTTYARDLAVRPWNAATFLSRLSASKVAGPEGDSWAEDEDGFPLRTLQKIALFDVSPVTYPAYTDSTSGVGSRALELLAELAAFLLGGWIRRMRSGPLFGARSSLRR
jgi:phage head maturation protease